MAAWTYLLLSEHGGLYCGATRNLRKRLRDHNGHGSTKRYTFGRRWHLLAAVKLETVGEALSYESNLKRLPHHKTIWKIQSIPRAIKIVKRHGYDFDPQMWRSQHHPSYVRAADKAGTPPYRLSAVLAAYRAKLQRKLEWQAEASHSELACE